MKKSGVCHIGLVLLLGSGISFAQDMSDIEGFARAFMAAEKIAWEQGEFDQLLELEHEDVIFQNINGTVFQGWEGHRQAITDTRNGWMGAEVETEWQYLMGDGNMFAVSYVWTIHLAEQPLVINGIAVGRLEDGKLKEEWGAGSILSMPGN